MTERPTLRSLCYPERYKLLPSQKAVARLMSSRSKRTGLLVYHKVGAGKTCAAIRVGEQWKSSRRIIVATAASLVDSFKRELRTQCVKIGEYVLARERKDLENGVEETIERIDRRISKHYTVLSYHKFVEGLREDTMNLKRAVLIIDEVQNIVSFTGSFYRTILEGIMDAPKSLRVLLLSATPISDNPAEIGLTLNLLRPVNPFPNTIRKFSELFLTKSCNPRNLSLFRSMVQNCVSFNRGAPRIAFPKKNFHLVKCKMTTYQYKCYQTVQTKEGPFRSGEILALSNQFYIGCRMLSNVAFPNHATKDSGLSRLQRKHLHLASVRAHYSPKFYRVIRAIKRAKGPVFVYSTFKGAAGVAGLQKILDAQNYKSYFGNGTGVRRYAVWTGETPLKRRIALLDDFNHPDNATGKKVKVLFGTPAMKEGVSLKRVSEVHILEPHWNNSRITQVIGRAVRFCSHKDVPVKRRKVDIYMYISTYPGEETVDQYIYAVAKKKDRLINSFLRIIRQESI